MRLLSSPNSTPSSSSSYSAFDPKFCSSASATASCLTRILRRILCSQSLPTHPSDHITVSPSLSQPGIIGRLMGLDTLPCSTNSIDHQKDLKHKQARSKLSLLEMPAFFELENEDFFVITFDKRDTRSKKRETQHHTRRRRKGASRSNGNVSKNIHLGCSEDDNKLISRVSSNSDSTVSTNKNASSEEQEDCGSQDLSPVSVLDFDQFLFDPCARSGDCTIRKKLSTRLEDYIPLSTYTEENCAEDARDSNLTEGTCQQSGNKYSPRDYSFKRQSEICRLAKAQAVQWNWKINDVEDVSADFGLGILDQLLQELVDQFLTSSL